MKKFVKITIPLLTIPFVMSCGSANASNDNRKNSLTNTSNETCTIDIYCEDCYVGKGSSIDDLLWQTSLNTSATVGEEISFYFKEKSGCTLPSDVYSIYETESHTAIVDYTYLDEVSYKKLTFTPTVSTTIEVIGAKDKDECAEITWNTTEENEKVGFSYNGGLNFVDWGDGTINNELVHAYANVGDHTAKIYGAVNSILVGNKNPNSNLYIEGNKDITSVKLKNKITSIPAGAFSNCERIEQLIIPNNVTNIASRSLSGCNALSKIEISENNPNFKSYTGHDIVKTNTSTLVYSNTSSEIDDSITAIGDYAYEGSNIKSLVIGNNIKTIGNGAFKDCKELNVIDMTQSTIPPTLSDNPFEGSGLVSIEVANEEATQALEKYWGEKITDVADKASFPSEEEFQILPFEDGQIKFKATWTGMRENAPALINLCVKNYADASPVWSDPIKCEYNLAEYGTVEVTLANVKANKPVRLRAPLNIEQYYFGPYYWIDSTRIGGDSCWSFLFVNNLGEPASYNISGKLMSLVSNDPYYETSIGGYFSHLFTQEEGTTKGLVDASKLILPPATHDGCYLEMFRDCATLVAAPNLPADDFIPHDSRLGYFRMFYNCKSLTQAPELPSTALIYRCYYEMFYGCSSLVNAPSILPAMSIISEAYYGMFRNCTSLKKTPVLPAVVLGIGEYKEEDCYSYMFSGCASLEEAPNLPATTLLSGCYSYMFQDCTSLKSTPIMEAPVSSLPDSCYSSMFSGCTSLTNARSFYIPRYIGGSSFYSTFKGCTSLVYAPEFIYTTETTGYSQYSFRYTFTECTSLITAPRLPDPNDVIRFVFQYMFRYSTSLKFTDQPQTDGVDNILVMSVPSSLTPQEVNQITAMIFADTGSDPAISKLAAGTNYYYIPQ